jgi:very-short-patch-repair endonuclease
MNQIEQMFYDALLEVFRLEVNDELYTPGTDTCDYLCLFSPGELYNIEILDYQHPIGIYVVDFYIESISGLKFVVEIDGHETHKTKEQRFKDYKRERLLQEDGIIVFRFMASEVYVNAFQCAKWTVETIGKYDEKLSERVIDAYESGRNKE